MRRRRCSHACRGVACRRLACRGVARRRLARRGLARVSREQPLRRGRRGSSKAARARLRSHACVRAARVSPGHALPVRAQHHLRGLHARAAAAPAHGEAPVQRNGAGRGARHHAGQALGAHPLAFANGGQRHGARAGHATPRRRVPLANLREPQGCRERQAQRRAAPEAVRRAAGAARGQRPEGARGGRRHRGRGARRVLGGHPQQDEPRPHHPLRHQARPRQYVSVVLYCRGVLYSFSSIDRSLLELH